MEKIKQIDEKSEKIPRIGGTSYLIGGIDSGVVYILDTIELIESLNSSQKSPIGNEDYQRTAAAFEYHMY